MHPRIKLALIGLFALLAALTIGVAVLWLVSGKSTSDVNTSNVNTPSANVNGNVGSNANTNTPTNIETPAANANVNPVTGIDLSDDPELLSKTFAERYGSFSTDSDFANVENLYPYMSESLQATETASVEAQRKSPAKDSYGVSTRVITTQSNALNDSYAKFTHSTRRTEARIGQDDRSYNQTIVIELQKTADGWRVTSATWQS